MQFRGFASVGFVLFCFFVCFWVFALLLCLLGRLDTGFAVLGVWPSLAAVRESTVLRFCRAGDLVCLCCKSGALASRVGLGHPRYPFAVDSLTCITSRVRFAALGWMPGAVGSGFVEDGRGAARRERLWGSSLFQRRSAFVCFWATQASVLDAVSWLVPV